MFKRKLTALEYENAKTFDVESELDFQKLIFWLENSQLKLLKDLHERAFLDPNQPNFSTKIWLTSFSRYLRTDMNCPLAELISTELNENFVEKSFLPEKIRLLDWILNFALRFIYLANFEFYDSFSSHNQLQNPSKSTLKSTL
eukprot:Sdes_comp24868_c0_seq1m22570